MTDIGLLLFWFIYDKFGWICISYLWILTLAAYRGRRDKK